MKSNRRDFLRKAGISGMIGAAGISGNSVWAGITAGELSDGVKNGRIIKIPKPANHLYHEPLERITVDAGAEGFIEIYDGSGVLYATVPVTANTYFWIGGSLGTHTILLLDKKRKLLDIAALAVNCKTKIEDKKGEFKQIADMLFYEISNSDYGLAKVVRLGGKTYHYFSSWFQDHMYVMQAQKYFYPELKSGVDLYFEGQRKDGMFHDNFKHKYEKDGSWSRRFDYGGFVKVPDDPQSSAIFVRVPLENIAEFSMIEGTYYTWKAVGDDTWMKEKLEGLLKAVNYITTDPYRWSDKFQLIRKGYSIDIWDFQNQYDSALVGNDVMRVELGKTPFGILYADNARMAYSCQLLAEMLDYHAREEDASKIRSLGKELKERIDKLSWNGNFYTHRIPEDPDRTYDFGVDEKTQVTLSNAYHLNHGATHEQAVAIIKTYQRIRKEMPKTSPGEWYCCYPPFERGWGRHPKWTYMNGGVSPIAAGQISHGAFEHGFEEYAVDILRRVYALVQKTGGTILGGYRGAFPDAPKRSFTKLNIRGVVNADLYGKGAMNVMGWTGEGENDLHNMPVGSHVFQEIPFDVVDPSTNKRKAVLILSGDRSYKMNAEVAVNANAKSLYLLHACSKTNFPGYVVFHYTDHTKETIAVKDKLVGEWWNPTLAPSDDPQIKIAWNGPNDVNKNVGVYAAGINVPSPDKVIEKIELIGPRDTSKWMILSLTLSDTEVFFMPEHQNSIPTHWAAAECYYALMEGLCGIKDTGVAYNKALIAPRWEAAGTDDVTVTAKYEASGGYVSYRYKKISANEIQILFTGNGNDIQVEALMPQGKMASAVIVNNKPVAFENKMIENSEYTTVNVKGTGVFDVKITI